MIRNILIFSSSLIAFSSYIVYAVAILKRKAKPHRITRFTILLITSITTASLFFQKNTVAIWLSGVFAFCSFFIFLLTLKYGMGGWAKTDIFCLVLSLMGILFWKITQNPAIALYFSIMADFAGVFPTLMKIFKYPKTEVWTFFFMDVIAAFLNLLATNNWAFSNIIFPLYIMIMDFIIILLIIRPVRIK